MTNQVIPEAAVKAAYAAWFAHKSLLTPGDTKVAMREALEAGAPHMVAQALLDAVEAFPLETITAPDNAVVWLRRRAEQIRMQP